MMRILQVNKYLYPKGGAEVVCLNLAEALRNRGHEVHLFGMDDPRNPACDDADCFPPHLDYHARRGFKRKTAEALRTIYGLRARRGMAEVLDRRRPDIVHAHNIYHQLTPSILAPARERGIPVLLTLHDYKPLCPVYTFLRHGEVCERCLGKWPWPLLKARCKDGDCAASAVLFAEAVLHRLLRSYQLGVICFTAPSRFLRDKMIAGGTLPTRVVHLPNALPFPATVLSRPWQAPPSSDAPRLIWVGRMSHEKGLGTLFRAMAVSKHPFRLQLVGDGPEEVRLKTLAAELALGSRLEWLGRRSREEVPMLIAAAEGSILPSEWHENAPLSVLEAMALGRPVIASDVGGVAELLEAGESGWLYPSGDVAALSGVLDEWAASRDERTRRGHEAYSRARAGFHPDRILDQTLELYRRLLV